MNKKEVYTFLKERNIWHEIMEHKAVYNMKEKSEILTPYPEAEAKNLFVRDDKKENYYLITVKGYKKIDLKKFRRINSTRHLSFASESDLLQIIGLTPGAVTPLGLLNNTNCKVKFYIDEEFFKQSGIIGVHPNENTATVWLKTNDLIGIIKEHGNSINIFEA